MKEVIGNKTTNSETIQILVYSNESNQESIIKLKKIICPECKEDVKLKINNYKICLYECKNMHQINDISFND